MYLPRRGSPFTNIAAGSKTLKMISATESCEHDADSRVGHQVCLDFCDINVRGTIETQRRCQRQDDLAQEAVQVRVRGALDVQVAAADIGQGLVVHHFGHISVYHPRSDVDATDPCEDPPRPPPGWLTPEVLRGDPPGGPSGGRLRRELQQRVHAEHWVVWLHDGCGNLRARPDSEADLRLLP